MKHRGLFESHPFGSPLVRRLLLALAVGLTWASAPCVCAADPLSAAVDLHKKYATDIGELAQWCETNGLTAEAQQTRRALPPRDPCKLYLPVLPTTANPAAPPAEASPQVVEWHKRFTALRREHATALCNIARHAARNGRATLAFEIALAAVESDPNYEPLRRLLGYQKYRDEWRTPYEVRKLRSGAVWSDKFGWLPKAAMRRYEDGQRLYQGRWISADEDAERHRDIHSGWNIETEHYTIRTNHSIAAGVALGVKLERLYRIWQQLFIRYYATQADVMSLFDARGRSQAVNLPRLQVVYFRNAEDYRQTLRAVLPEFETDGLYRDRVAYFFVHDGGDDRTLYHEATHQLFHEARPVVASPGRNANFWIIEGIATYMESLRQEDGYFVLGGREDQRMYAARVRLLRDKFHVPLAELTSYGMERFQKDPRIATLYSEAAGLTNFLVHYDGGRYCDVLVAYLAAVYSGRDAPTTLARLAGVSYDELDKQYREFIAGGGTGPAAGSQ